MSLSFSVLVVGFTCFTAQNPQRTNGLHECARSKARQPHRRCTAHSFSLSPQASLEDLRGRLRTTFVPSFLRLLLLLLLLHIWHAFGCFLARVHLDVESGLQPLLLD